MSLFEIRDYIDQLYLLGKRHGLNTFLIQKMVEEEVKLSCNRSVRTDCYTINVSAYGIILT